MMHYRTRTFILFLSILLFSAVGLAKEKSRVRMGGDVIVPLNEEVKDAVAIGGDVTVYGTIEGSAVAVGGDVILESGAVVRESCVSVGGEVRMSEGAVVYGDVVEIGNFDFSPNRWPGVVHGAAWGIPWIFKIFSFMAVLIIGTLLIVIFPRQFDIVAGKIQTELGPSLGAGLIGIVLFVPVLLTLLISILGIPLIPLFIVTTILMTVFGYFAIASVVGRTLLAKMGNATPSAVLQIVAGLFIFWLIGFIPGIGFLIKSLAALFGYGAVLLVFYHWRKPPHPTSAPSAPVAPVDPPA